MNECFSCLPAHRPTEQISERKQSCSNWNLESMRTKAHYGRRWGGYWRCRWTPPNLNCYGGIWLKTTLTFSNAMLFVYSQWKFTMLTPPVKCPRTFYPGELPAGKIWLRFKTTRTLVNIWPPTGALRRGFILGWIKRKSGTETKPNPFVW